MPYRITFRPRSPIPGQGEQTIEEETAIAAWALFQQLDASDETVTSIKDPDGKTIGWQELRARADREAN
jgi:hypothetical protein